MLSCRAHGDVSCQCSRRHRVAATTQWPRWSLPRRVRVHPLPLKWFDHNTQTKPLNCLHTSGLLPGQAAISKAQLRHPMTWPSAGRQPTGAPWTGGWLTRHSTMRPSPAEPRPLCSAPFAYLTPLGGVPVCTSGGEDSRGQAVTRGEDGSPSCWAVYSGPSWPQGSHSQDLQAV